LIVTIEHARNARAFLHRKTKVFLVQENAAFSAQEEVTTPMQAMHQPQEHGTLTGLPAESKEKKSTPIKRFQAGAITATVWENADPFNPYKAYRTVSFDRTFQDKQGKWRSSNSLRATDLPKAVIVLKKAYEFLVLRDWAGNPSAQ